MSEKTWEDALMNLDAVAVDTLGQTALHKVAQARGADNRTQLARRLIESGANINAKDNNARTPLHCALAYQKADDLCSLVRLLLANGADVNAKDKNGDTSLHLAVRQKHDEVLSLLVANGADVNARDSGGTTPLHLAAYLNCKDFAELLIRKGADVSAVSEKGVSPLGWANQQRNEKIKVLLRAHGAKLSSRETLAQVLNSLFRLPSLMRKRAKRIHEQHVLRDRAERGDSEILTMPDNSATQEKKPPAIQAMRAVLHKQSDPPIKINPFSVTHQFLVLTRRDLDNNPEIIALLNSEEGVTLIRQLNREFQPLMWNNKDLFILKFGWFAAEPDKDGHPTLQAFPQAMAEVGVPVPYSLVTTTRNVSFNGGSSQLKIWIGFAFRDNDPRIICCSGSGGCITA